MIFSPLFQAQFLHWDDGQNLFENPRMLPPTLENCAYYWRHPSLSLYIPVTYTIWSGLAFISQKPGDEPGNRTLNPQVFHIANVSVHALAVVVVFNILRMVMADWPAALGALLFAVHPIQVEVVGWACGMKDLLAGLFGLIAVWQYLLHARISSGRFSRYYLIASCAFGAATLSKPSAIITPLVCAILAVGLLWMPWRRALYEMTPWIFLSAVIAVIAIKVQPSNYQSLHVAIWARPLISADAMAFYLLKLAWPVNLCLDYGRSPGFALGPPDYFAWWTWIIPAALGAVLLWNRKRWPRIATALLVSIAALAPVLGLVRFNYQTVSTVTDHYFYFAMLGPAIALGSLLQARGKSLAVAALAASGLIFLSALCHAQTFTWMSDETAFTHVVEVNPRSAVGHSHLWQLQMNARHFDAAEDEARAVIAATPELAAGYLDLGDTLSESSRWREAADAYQRAIDVEPGNPIAYNNLGSLYGSHGDPGRAIPLYRKALELNQNYAAAKIGLATALRAVGSGHP